MTWDTSESKATGPDAELAAPQHDSASYYEVGPGTSQPDVLERLTRGSLTRRTLEVFPTGYFATISVIQGVALVSLADKATTEIVLENHPPIVTVGVIGKSIFMLLGIIAVSYEYFWFNAVMRWPPTFRDTLVPFFLGAAEITSSLLIAQTETWWRSSAVFLFLGSIALLNTVTRLHIEAFNGEACIYRLVWRLGWHLSILILTASMFSLTVSFFVPSHNLLDTVLPYVLMSCVVGVVATSERHISLLYERYRINARPSLSDTIAALRGGGISGFKYKDKAREIRLTRRLNPTNVVIGDPRNVMRK